MKKLMIKIALVAIVATSVGVIMAQDMVTSQDAQPTVTETMDPDKGPEIVKEADAKQPEIKQEQENLAAEEKFIPAATAVKTMLKKQLGLRPGYDRKRKAIIVIGEAEKKIADPSDEKEMFMHWRQLKAMEAYLSAKAEIVRSINGDMHGIDRFASEFSEGEDDVTKVCAEKKAAFEAKKAELAKILAQLDEKEAEAFAGVTISDRFDALLDAIIKKFDATYSKDGIAVEKQAVYERLKAESAALSEEYKQLEKDAKSFPQYPQNELNNDVTLIGKMPLLGASVLIQYESWDKSDKTYSVAMAVVWSPKLETNARKLMQGDLAPSEKKGAFSIDDWIDQQYLPTMLGSRRITDNEGNTIFIGIGAEDVSGSVISRKAKRALADTDAIQWVGRSLYTDINAYREAHRNGKEYTDELSSAKAKLAEIMSSKLDVNLKGCSRLTSIECEHPISGRKTYVSVYYIDPELNKEAAKLMANAYADAGLAVKATQYSRGVHAGYQQALDDVKKSKVEYNRGVKDGKKTVEQTISATEAARRNARQKGKSLGSAGTQSTKKASTSQGGTFSGDAAVDTDF